MLAELTASPFWVPGTHLLMDHRKLDMHHVSPDDMVVIKDTALHFLEKLGHGRCAFIVETPVGFGLSRMYEELGGSEVHHSLAIFFEEGPAIDWLKGCRHIP
jgi:hypothetical protein